MPAGSLLGMNVGDFLDRLGSDYPTPGGGSVAALVGALAAGLGRMACAFTLGRPKYAEVEKSVQHIETRLRRAENMLRRLVDEDADAYAQLNVAFKLDRGDPTRDERIAAAAAVAAGVPFQTAALSRQVVTDLEALSQIANPRLKSDVDAGVHLAQAAFDAAVANVRINLPYLAATDAARIDHELQRLLLRSA